MPEAPQRNIALPWGWENERLLGTAADYYASLLQGLTQARHSVCLESYIFEDDGIGGQVVAALVAAASRGVNVRVIVDGLGSYFSLDRLIRDFADSGVELRIYHPPPWRLGAYRFALSRRRRLEQFIYTLIRINHRNHRKLCVVDSCCAWVGSFNISDSHSEEHSPHWRDIAVYVEGKAIRGLVKSFGQLWKRRQLSEPARGYLRQFFSTLSPVSRYQKNRALIDLIDRARYRLWIASAYFSPSGAILRAMKRAARRGVDVRLMVSARSDILFFPALTATYYSDLLKQGVVVYEYQAGVMHAKAMLIDELAIIGSSNLNHRSLLHDLELDVLLDKETTIADLTACMEQDRSQSVRITLEDLPRYQLSILMGWLPRLSRYWL